ncbi:MAG: site-specific integrase [Candidatus Acidiferrum sp.]
MIIARHLGLRVSEAAKIKPADWNAFDHSLTLNERKCDNNSTLPLPAELRSTFAMCAQRAPNTPIVFTLGARSISRQTVHTHLQKALKKAKITRPLHFHDLRRTIATDVLLNTKDLRQVQRLLGHRHLATTFAYIGDRELTPIRQALESTGAQQPPTVDLQQLQPATEVKQ